MSKHILDNSDLLWTDNVVHLGNYINSACNDDVDCNIRHLSLLVILISSCIIIKTNQNYGRLQTSVLINLFMLYCCSFYVSIYGNSILLVLISAANPGL